MELPELNDQGSGQVFIELDEFFPQAAEWKETHRWNFGMEEDLVGLRALARAHALVR